MQLLGSHISVSSRPCPSLPGSQDAMVLLCRALALLSAVSALVGMLPHAVCSQAPLISPVTPRAQLLTYRCSLQAIRNLDGGEWNGRRLLVERARNVR